MTRPFAGHDPRSRSGERWGEARACGVSPVETDAAGPTDFEPRGQKRSVTFGGREAEPGRG